MEAHSRATERHLPYGIPQCYLPPDTGELTRERHLYRSTNAVSAENLKFFPPLSFSALSFGMTPSNLWKSFIDPETRVFQAAEGEDLVILACTVLD